MGKIVRTLKYAFRVLKFGSKVAARMAQLESAIAKLRAVIAAAKKLAEKYRALREGLEEGSARWLKLIAKEEHVLAKAVKAERERSDLATRLARLLQGLSETL